MLNAAEKPKRGRKKGGPKALGDEVEQYISDRAVNDYTKRELLAENIQNELEAAGYPVPSLETLMKKISKARSHVDDKLDGPWSVGSCPRYNISHEYISDLIRLQKLMMKKSAYLTTRRARWLSFLYPVLRNKASDLGLLQISAFYSRKEQLAEINGLGSANTFELDKVFLTGDEPVAFGVILQEWIKVYFPHIEKNKQRNRETETKDKRPLILGTLTTEVNELLEQFQEILTSSKTNKEKQSDLEDFMKEHPELESKLEEWLVFSTRRDWTPQSVKKDGDK